jgi:hypothetical protein
VWFSSLVLWIPLRTMQPALCQDNQTEAP